MTAPPTLARIGALVGDPGRANMLGALMDGRALTAGELARTAGITAATASGHLGRLVDGGLLAVATQGRHRYYRLASPAIARMLEGMMTAAGPEPLDARRVTPRVDPAMRAARSCYDHLAGRLGVALADALIDRGDVALGDDTATVTPAGAARLAAFGLSLDGGRGTRPLCRPCLDWTERRPHLAGTLGAALCRHCEALGWIRRNPGTRAVAVTPAGEAGFRATFGIAL